MQGHDNVMIFAVVEELDLADPDQMLHYAVFHQDLHCSHGSKFSGLFLNSGL